MIEIRDLKKTFGSQVVLDGVNLTIESGETVAIVGPSGTGKSVLLKIITGLLPADGGEVRVNGRSMTGAKSGTERRSICATMGVLFQNAALFDSINLLENVAFPLRHRRAGSNREVLERALKSLHDVGLEGYELALPGEVSIGMRKRVGIARALVTNPEILLFDEPNTGLDPEMGQDIYELIIKTQRMLGFTGLVISHEIPEVFQVCSRVVMLYGGKVQEDASVEGFARSENPYVKQFVAGSVEGPIAFH